MLKQKYTPQTSRLPIFVGTQLHNTLRYTIHSSGLPSLYYLSMYFINYLPQSSRSRSGNLIFCTAVPNTPPLQKRKVSGFTPCHYNSSRLQKRPPLLLRNIYGFTPCQYNSSPLQKRPPLQKRNIYTASRHFITTPCCSRSGPPPKTDIPL